MKQNYLMIAGAALAALVLGLAIGFNGARPQAAHGAGAAEAHYAMNVVVSGVPFWTDTRATWSAIDNARSDVVNSYGGPLDTDAQAQIQEVESSIANGAQGLVIAPANSAALTPTIDAAVNRGIPVVTLLTDAPRSHRLTYITSELEGASTRIANAITQATPPRGKAIIIYAQAGNEEQEARRRGFEQFIAAHSGMQLVGVIADNYDENKGAELLAPLLARNRDIRFIFGANSRSAVGAVSALRQLNYTPGQVVVTGWDTDADVLNLVRDGWVSATVAQQSAYMTQLAFSIVDAAHRGYLNPSTRDFAAHGVSSLPGQITVPVAIVTRQNVAGYFPRAGH